MVQPFTCAVVCPAPAVLTPETDPFSDTFSFRHAQKTARQNGEAALQLAQVAAEGADLIVLPEDLHGVRHFWRMLEAPHMLRRLAEPVPGPTTKIAGRIAKRNKAHLSLTLYENAGNAVYNTTVLLGPRGKLLARYRKTHLAPGEDWLVTPGKALTAVKTRLGRIGFACGEDYYVPETACVLARLGIEIVLCPSRAPIPELVLCSRSFESGFITVFAHQDGALLVDQRASVLAQSAGRRDCFVTATFIPLERVELDRGDLDRILTGIADGRKRLSSRRRPELYRTLVASTWPERPKRRGSDKQKWQAHGLLSASWEEGSELLPPWEI